MFSFFGRRYYRYYSKTFPTKPYATADGLELTAQILKKYRPEAKDIQAKDWLNNRFMAELEKEGFLARCSAPSRVRTTV